MTVRPRALVLLLVAGLLGGSPPERTDRVKATGKWQAPRGIALGLYSETSARHGLAWPPDPSPIAELGANTVLLSVRWTMNDVHSSFIERGPDTVSDADLRRVVRAAHRNRLQVVLVPTIVLREGSSNEWRGNIAPNNRTLWWQSYDAMVLHYAAFAERCEVSAIVIAHELSSMIEASRLAPLVDRVRSSFHGSLAIVLNHDALEQALPFDTFDLVGVSAYFPLTEGLDPSASELAAGWERAARELRDFSNRLGRPITIFEVGYPSVDGAARRPWDYTTAAPIDMEEQAESYRAAVDAFERLQGVVDGAIFWEWFGPGGRYDRGYTPRGKPAEQQVRRFFISK